MAGNTSLARNAVYSAVSSASSVFLIALVIMAARILGNKAFGEFSFALAIASIFEMFTDLGLNVLSARNISRDRRLAGVYLPNMLAWKLVLSVVAMCLMFVTVILMHQSREAQIAAFIMGGAIVLRSYKSTSFGFFQAFERFDLILLTTYVERLSGFIVVLTVLLLTRSLIPFAIAFALVRIPDILITYWFIHTRITPVRFRLDRPLIRDLQISAIPFAISSIVIVAYLNVGTVILSAMRPPMEVGWYNAGYKIYEGLTTFPFLISAVLLPRLSRLFLSDREQYTALCRRSLRYLVLSALPLVAIIGAFTPQIIRLVYGQAYVPGIPVLKILLIAAVFMFMNWVLNTMIIAANMEKRSLAIWTVGLAVLSVANVVLVRWLGMIGAAYSVVLSEVCVFALMAFIAQRELFRVPAGDILLRPIAAGTVAFGALLLTPVAIPIASSAVFVAAYVAILLALRTFDAEEWAAVKGLLAQSIFRG